MDYFNVVSVLLGAIVGSLSSYYAVTKLEQNKKTDIICRLHCLLILEVSCHQASLVSEIDRLSPSWSEKHIPESYQNLKDYIYYISLPNPYFRQFLGDLIYSPLLLGIANYYRNVAWLNDESTELEQDKHNDKLVHSYVRGCAGVLEASIDLMDELLKTKEIEQYKSDQLNAKINDFKRGKERYKELVALIVGK